MGPCYRAADSQAAHPAFNHYYSCLKSFQRVSVKQQQQKQDLFLEEQG